eukprot:10464449-Alexandrium_andersonii.AAC.1
MPFSLRSCATAQLLLPDACCRTLVAGRYAAATPHAATAWLAPPPPAHCALSAQLLGAVRDSLVATTGCCLTPTSRHVGRRQLVYGRRRIHSRLPVQG